jgi:diaminohydroxyphosphoribosylaminopyrimidine deaminase / 5-amino-6-(5-phosphoribosylamino)uracil reductase
MDISQQYSVIMYSKFQRRCFDLARLGIGKTLLNPPVGSIIVDTNNMVVGEGWHEKFGQAHAEVNAVNDAIKLKDDFKKDTIYVSLEPCFHYGKTPPCIDLILEHKFEIVNITVIDPNPKVSGKSKEKLETNHIKIEYDENLNNLSQNQLNPYFEKTFTPFLIQNRFKRPFIILKWAESCDGFIGKEDEQIHISNQYSKRLVHKLRAECDAILVGTNTIFIDNPELSNRYYFGKSPKRVIIDRTLKLTNDFIVFDNSIETIVFTEKNSSEYENQSNLNYQKIDFNENMLTNMLDILFQKNVGVLLVEGGQKLLKSFIEIGLWDRAYIFKSVEILRGGIPAPNLSESFFSKEELLGNNTIRYYKNQFPVNL